MKLSELSFLFFIALIALLGFLFPPIFTPLLPYLSYLLAVVMLIMGLTLKKEDLNSALINWKFALLGTILQFLLMPSIAYFLTVIFDVPQEYKLGLVLVGTCPGGTASNVIVYLFNGKVSLSVLMTFMSTVLSVFMTPSLLEFYLGKQMDLPTQKMIVDIFILVIIPLALGLVLQRFIKPNLFQTLEKAASKIAITVIGVIIAAIVASNAQTFKTISYLIVLLVILHNGLGLLLGYYLTKIFTKDKMIARTVAIEVGMQNSGLGVVLANLHFTKVVALPSAIFSFWHNVSGIILANIWKKSDEN